MIHLMSSKNEDKQEITNLRNEMQDLRLEFKKVIRMIGSVHLTKSYTLKILYLLYDYQKQNTFKVRILWSVFVFFRSIA